MMNSRRKILETASNSDPIRGGIIRQSKKHQKNKSRTKPRSFAKAFSVPIRRLYKLGRIGNDTNKKEKISSEQQVEQLVEHNQHLITPVHTFDTQEVIISPRSIESLTVEDSSSHFQESNKVYQILIGEEQQDIGDGGVEQEWVIRPSRAFDMNEIFSPRSFGSLKTGDGSSYIENDGEKYKIQIKSDEQQNNVCGEQLECQDNVCCTIGSSQLQPQQELDLEANLNEWGDVESNISSNYIACRQQMDPDNGFSMTENEESSMSTNTEVDSLMPAMGDSLYFEDEDGDNYDDSNHLPPHRHSNAVMTSAVSGVAEPPFKVLDISINYDIDIEEKEMQQKDYHQEEVGSSTSSYNSYLHAIGNITTSTSVNVEKVREAAIDKVDAVTLKRLDLENNGELEELYVSFTPSNGMYLQAMEGASAKAKIDIERATALALSKINIAASSVISCKEADNDEKTKTKSIAVNAVGYSHNRVLGFLFFLFLFLGLNGNSLTFLENIRSISNFAAVDDYNPTQQDDVISRNIAEEEHMQLSIWVESQITESVSNDVSKKDKTVHDVVCALSSSLFGPWLYFN